ncbi:hypothetical protein X824_gp030 [Escherichia phage 4MG]|uniref:Putative membrane protein n=1 Tax=Escherichia phage 4MG TaxID=1391428 RepID=V5KSB0_9CAUD|nr:hypothetical protein X824_gp030 [Escherichia phage 4MG]AGZ17504.1 putative membrane protein [Escherichia phage 4MG]
MIGFWEWYTMHNNWVSSVILLVIFGFWGWSLGSGFSTWKHKTVSYLFVGAVGFLMFYLGTYQGGYGMYKRHWTTCSKPAAVEAFYVFDAQKERCFKPVVGFAPVDDNQVKTLTPKQMETGEWL